MQKFSNMPLSEVASAAVPAARRVAVPTAKPASLSAEALNIPRSGIRDVFDRVERCLSSNKSACRHQLI